MCGIAGLWQRDGAALDPAAAVAMATAQRHRGPDDEGYAAICVGDRRATPAAGRDTRTEHPLPSVLEAGRGADLILAFRRLSILDLSPLGHQPMASPDGRQWIVFNGEIYNYVELRETLRAAGHVFRTGSDTEVLLAALAEWDVAALPRLIGMFAFAHVDLARGRLLLARDPFGIKPLYIAETPGRLAFASELKALLAVPGQGRRADPQAVHDYLRYASVEEGTRTFFDGIRRLPAAHWMAWDLARPQAPATEGRYWMPALDGNAPQDLATAARALRETFESSIRLHLRADVPVGAALSGGIDSSAIVCGMRAAAGPALTLHAFSYLADDPALSEERWVRLVAGHVGAQVHEVRASPGDLTADLDTLIRVQDEPFAGTSIYAQWRVFQRARADGITVTQDGQGADELYAGYPFYLTARLVGLWRAGRVAEALAFARVVRARPDGAALWRRAVFLGLPTGLVRAVQRVRRASPDVPWLRRAWFAERHVAWDPWRDDRLEGPTPPLRALLWETLQGSGLPALLRYADRNAMAASVESRVPFLVPALAEQALAMPDAHLIGPDGGSKRVLRAALRGLVPDAVLDRTDKIGFATPEASWLATLEPWVRATLTGDAASRVPGLDGAAAMSAWQGWRAAGHTGWGPQVWRWVNVVRWAELFDVAA